MALFSSFCARRNTYSPPPVCRPLLLPVLNDSPGIHDAAEHGNAGLVRDHIVANPAAMHSKDLLYAACRPIFFLKITP